MIIDHVMFLERALGAIWEFMENDGQQLRHRRFVKRQAETLRFAKPPNRSVTGSMAELVVAVEDDIAVQDSTGWQITCSRANDTLA